MEPAIKAKSDRIGQLIPKRVSAATVMLEKGEISETDFVKLLNTLSA